MGFWVQDQYDFQRTILAYQARTLAVELPFGDQGILDQDPRFEVVSTPTGELAAATPDGTLWVQPISAVLTDLEDTRWRRYRMVVGEGSLLFILVGVCSLMLYRLVVAERRVRQEMGRFVGQLTHDMKTPLVGLKALLETVRLGRVPADQLDEMVRLGLGQIERQEHLVENLLVAQRIRLSEPSLHRARLELAPLVTRFRGHRLDVLLDADQSLEVHGEAVAIADEDAVWTILENLVDNAFKYGARRVVLNMGVDKKMARLECADDGQGFAPDRAEALFHAWEREQPGEGWHGGTGLGLEISRGLARSMGGELCARSEGTGQGACFTLQLPAA
jgi:signal transduction histidine kinase